MAKLGIPEYQYQEQNQERQIAVGCAERRENGDYMLTSIRGGSSGPLLKFSGGSSGLV